MSYLPKELIYDYELKYDYELIIRIGIEHYFSISKVEMIL